MIDQLDDLLKFQTTALNLRSERQAVLSANIVNADTPNYKAVDFDFAQALRDATATQSPDGTLKPTMLYRTPSQPSLDGNTVELDAERAKFADNAVRYEAALKFLNAQIKTMLAALQS